MLTVLNKYLEPSALADECVVGRWILSLNEEERNTFAKLKEHSNSVKLAALYKDLLSEGHETEREMVLEKFKHNFPKVMVILIPFLAFFLWLFYIRKKMLYVEHLIFVIYTHCFIYLFLTISVLVSLLWDSALEWSLLIIFIYIVASMKNFYQQGLFKTIVKFFMVGICYSILLIVGIIANAIIAAM